MISSAASPGGGGRGVPGSVTVNPGGVARPGGRPSFDRAAPPEEARPLVENLVEELRGRGFQVETGRFRETMEVELVNDGPLTFVFELWCARQSLGGGDGPRT
ncbi:MAG TPA: D-aminoacyl-tRNA deacylase [Thermoanaerobaculia bacterium]|nr:D-aminoacyl-tRNA deacylase [Thermoanaerobaculia bacterium]